MNNSDGKASLKRQKSPENTTDTQGMSNFYLFYEKNVHISKYVSLQIDHTSFPILFLITCSSSRSLTPSHTTRDAFMN